MPTMEHDGRIHAGFSRTKRMEAVSGYLFILPAVVPFLLFVLLPVVAALLLSVTNYDMLGAPAFVGMKNYQKLFSDMRMWTTLRNTAVFTLLTVTITNLMGLVFAFFISRKMSNAVSYLIRLTYFFPVIVAYAYVSLVWRYLLSQDTGVINYYLGLIGVKPVGWLLSVDVVLYALVLVDVWKNCGLAMIIFIAGIQNISPELSEAARIDGASELGIITRIKIPLLTPVIFFNMIVFMINSLQIYDPVKLLSNGGPGDASRTIVLYIYDNFAQMKMGYSSAVSLVLFVIIMSLTLIQFKFSDRWVQYSGS